VLRLNLVNLATFFSPVTLFWIVTWSMRSLGTYRTQLICGITTSIFTALTPFVVGYLPFWVLFCTRFIQGIALCNLYPVVGAIVNHWSCSNEKGLFVSILTGCELHRKTFDFNFRPSNIFDDRNGFRRSVIRVG
jgi:MFS family permease